MFKIYKIKNISNGKEYIGQTTQDIKRRFSQHMTTTSCCRILKEAVKEFGKENFKIELLEVAETKLEAKDKEGELIQEYQTIYPYGYNLLSSGFCSKHSDITKQKMSATRKGKHPYWATEASRSLEARVKRGNSLRGRKRSEEVILKQRQVTDKYCKPIKDQDGKVYRNVGDAAKELGLSRGNIQMVLRSIRKQTGGYIFEYI